MWPAAIDLGPAHLQLCLSLWWAWVCCAHQVLSPGLNLGLSAAALLDGRATG